MSVVNWDHSDSGDTPLSEKQLEAIFHLRSLDYRASPASSAAANADFQINPADEKKPIDNRSGEKEDGQVVHMQLTSHFYSWLSTIEQHMDDTKDEGDIKFLNHVASKRKSCNDLVARLEQVLKHLATLKENYQSVSAKTNSLHDACEHLLHQQNDLSKVIVRIENAMANFVNVDVVEAMEFRESETYLTRAISCLNRTLRLIIDHVTKIINRTINELMDLHDVVSPDNSFILLYGRFRSHGPKLRLMISLIEERTGKSAEYSQALQELHTFYLQRRETLLSPVVNSGILELLDKYPNDHCALLRTGGAFMVHVCEDETRLFSQFFNPKLSDALNVMLKSLCRCLYDTFRPLIIHVNHMEILSELCDILKYELVEEHMNNSQMDASSFLELCEMLLADVQERLIFRSYLYIKSQILGYEPSPGDLSYPEKLIMMNNIARDLMKAEKPPVPDPGKEGVDVDEENQVELPHPTPSDLAVQPGPNMSLSPADLHGMWYPTVRRTLVCLSKLSRCLDANTFCGLAQECVSMCVQSLVKASEAITTRRSAGDGQLFLIKHLLILREQMAPFNVEFSVKETSLDFSTYKDAAVGLWTRRGSGLFALNRNNLFLRFLLETPNVIEIEVDSRRQLDGQLKETCEAFINQMVAKLCCEVPQFLEKANNVLSAPGVRLADQAFSTPSVIREIVLKAHRTMSTVVGRGTGGRTNRPTETDGSSNSLHYTLQTYLVNPDTEGILARHIQTGALRVWRALVQLLSEHYSEEDRMIIACPTESQIRLLFQDS